MRLRRQVSAAPVKAWHTRLPQASQHDDVRLVRRITVVLDLLGHQVPRAVWCERGGRSPSCLSDWQKAVRWRGLASLVAQHGGGRPAKLTPRQTKRLVELLEAGPLVGGGETAGWHSVRIRVLLWRELGVLSKRHDVSTWRHHLGLALQQARWVSDPLDTAQRLAGRQDKWPAICRAAQRWGGLIRFAAEASLAPWGALSSTGARRGQPPEVPTRGQRQGDKVCGAMADVSGRRCAQGLEGRCHAEPYQACLRRILAPTPAHLFVSHDGARDHTSASTQACLAAQSARLTAEPLPAYAPDDHPLAYLWKQTQQRATHNQDFKECAARTISVEKARAYCATHPEEV
jgi:transposase